MLLIGQQFDRYRFERLLAQGGMSEIYLAVDTHLHRRVAIKVIRREVLSQSDTDTIKEAVHLFQREAKAVTMLEHPHILPLYDYGEVGVDGFILTYIVMPLRQEGSLATWIRKRSKSGILPIQEVAHFVRQAADALQYAHDHHIIHRDVKPSNFLISTNSLYPNRPDIQLADFGVAKFVNALTTPSHSVRGTPNYMAPEQWRGEAVPATDQYALAVMTYEMLTGVTPFEGENPQRVFYRHAYEEPQPASALNPHIPSKVDTVLLRALQKIPASRYLSISTFARVFHQALIRGGNISITLTISQSEIRNGTRRVVDLPEGQILLDLPPGVQDGEVLRYDGLGERPQYGGQAGELIVTIIVEKTEEVVTLSSAEVLEGTAPALDLDEIPEQPGHRWPFKGATFLLAGLAMLLILGGLGMVALSIFNGQRDTRNQSNAATTQNVETMSAQATSNGNLTSTAQGNLTTTAAAASATALAENAATATAQAGATATSVAAAATSTAYNKAIIIGTLTLNDPLQDNSQGYNWDTLNITGGGGCAFVQGAYHATMPQKGFFSPCFARNTDFSDFSYEVSMTIVNGDRGGICFRGQQDTTDSLTSSFYYFYINTDGSFTLETISGLLPGQILKQGSSPAIKTGLNQTNIIAVVAIANSIKIYVNMVLIASVTDSTYMHGQIGVIAQDVNNPTDVLFNNARVWVKSS